MQGLNPYLLHLLYWQAGSSPLVPPGEALKREGTWVRPWLIHADVWQKLTQYGKAIILQLKK